MADLDKPIGNLADLVHDAARRDPDRTALVAGTEVVTWADFDARVGRVAGGLRGLGLAGGDRVAIQLENVAAFPVAFFGALRAGLVAVPVSPASTERQLSAVLRDSGARTLVTSSVAAIGAAARLPIDHLVVAAGPAPDGGRALAELLAAAPVPARSDGDGLAAIVYTSGTSGPPKGAMLTHRALRANLRQCAHIPGAVLAPSDVLLLGQPLFHSFGLGPGLGMLAAAGATGVLVAGFDPAQALGLMSRHRVTRVIGTPAMYVAFAHDLDPAAVANGFATVRLALSGAAALPGDVVGRLRALTTLVVHEGYGLAEAGPVVTSTLVSRRRKPGSVGGPIPGVELWLRDEDGQPALDGDPGEVVVRGENLFSGYWPDGTGGPDEHGWFATGDIAYSDEDGDLFLVDRRRDTVLVSGFTVYPAEVEAVLGSHPGVAEAAVVGVPEGGNDAAVTAFVVRRAGARVSTDELLAWCGRSLARFKCPARVEFVDRLPHSATGKVRKAALHDAS